MWEINVIYRNEMQAIYDRLYEKLNILNQHRPLPSSAVHKIKEALSIEWTYNSNSIEGNTLTLRETQMVIQDGITIGGKLLREHYEATNHNRAIHFLDHLVTEKYIIRSIDILSIHEIVMRSIDDDFAGRLRNGNVRIAGANFTPPNAHKVSVLLDELIVFINSNNQQFNAIELATLFHHKFVWIHPFFDGNGRTARLAMNLLLMKCGFPPAIILKNDRKKYYDALNNANKGNYSKLMLLMAQSLERTLNIYLSAIPNAQDFKEISLLVEEEKLPYGQEYISLLARTGKIDAHKEGRNWLTTKDAVQNYVSQRKRNR